MRRGCEFSTEYDLNTVTTYTQTHKNIYMYRATGGIFRGSSPGGYVFAGGSAPYGREGWFQRRRGGCGSVRVLYVRRVGHPGGACRQVSTAMLPLPY